MTTISIHQPGYLPWLGFFKKIIFSDIFVFLDDVQYEKNGWHNRNKIRTNEGWIWLTVPVKSSISLNLNEVRIDNSTNWIQKHKKSIQFNYSKSKYFNEYWEPLELLYENDNGSLLHFNMKFINFFLKNLGIKTKTMFSSELKITKTSSDRILDICEKLGASIYISGALGKNYLNVNDFTEKNIQVKFQNFQHPVYNQIYEPFLPNMAFIDLLFNEGKNSSNILETANNF